VASTIQYLNTDLDLVSAVDLQPIGDAFQAAGACVLHVTRGDDGLYYAIVEADAFSREPEVSISALLSIIESFSPPLKSLWATCSKREFNIGYDCGDQPWGFTQVLSSSLVSRIAATGAAIGITLYPDRRKDEAEPRSGVIA